MQLRCDAKTVRLAYNIAGLPPKYLAYTSMRYSYLAHSSMRYSQLTVYVTWTDPVWHQVHNFPPYYMYVGEGATLMCVCVCAYSTYLIKHCRHSSLLLHFETLVLSPPLYTLIRLLATTGNVQPLNNKTIKKITKYVVYGIHIITIMRSYSLSKEICV